MKKKKTELSKQKNQKTYGTNLRILCAKFGGGLKKRQALAAVFIIYSQ